MGLVGPLFRRPSRKAHHEKSSSREGRSSRHRLNGRRPQSVRCGQHPCRRHGTRLLRVGVDGEAHLFNEQMSDDEYTESVESHHGHTGSSPRTYGEFIKARAHPRDEVEVEVVVGADDVEIGHECERARPRRGVEIARQEGAELTLPP